MFAPLPRAKRQRSSSPPLPQEYIDLTSPLDILIKRRRKEGVYTGDNYDAYPFPDTSPSNDPMEGSSSWFATRPTAAINGRRSRQWQHLNAPSSSVSSSSTMPLPHSQPVPQMTSRSGSSPFSVEHGRAHSQPDMLSHRHGRGHMMSSSPIRHEPPGSSPFRASGQSRLGMDMSMGIEMEQEEVLRAATPPPGQEDEWDEDELGREWGEYARENSVLHSLHRQRQVTSPASITETPSRPTSHQYPYNPQLHPTPYRDRPSSSASTHFLPSSPFHVMGTPSDMTRRNQYANEQDDMEVLGGGSMGESEEGEEVLSPGEREVRRRYEDANRLLAELAVERRRRWGES